jgi:Ham1 family
MLNILFATTNPGKLMRYQKHYSASKYEGKYTFYTLSQLGIKNPDHYDDDYTEQENAVHKADVFYNTLRHSDVDLPKGKWIVVSLHTGLYFDQVKNLEQPGAHIKRASGAGIFEGNDEEVFKQMSEYYSKLAKKYGGQLTGHFLDVFCIYDGITGFCQSAKRPITLDANMHTKDIMFPINSFLKIDNKFYHELDDSEYKKFLAPMFKALDGLLKNSEK